MILCPACFFEQAGGGKSCLRCGIIFAKARERAPRPAPARKPAAQATASARSQASSPSLAQALQSVGHEWKLLAGGLVAAIIVHAIPVLSFLLHPLVTLLHEFGHAVAAWSLGCPAIPAFDFVYGGGVTHHKNFQLPIGIMIGSLWAWLGWTFRRNPKTLTVIGVCVAVWLVAVSSEWRREVVISFMGHGGELILAGVLLYMALSGRGWRMPEVERPLGAFAAFFVQIQTMQFAWQLRNDAGYLAWYREGKGGALMNDLEVIALDIQIWTGMPTDIERVAGWLLGFSLVPIGAAILLHIYRERVNALARSLLLLHQD